MIQTAIIEDAFSAEAFVVKDEEGGVWSGTRYWMVREPISFEPTSKAIQTAVNLLSKATHELTWANEPGTGMGRVVRPRINAEQIVRVYQREDGTPVLINESFIKVIEAMVLTVEPEYDDGDNTPYVDQYALRQVDDPLGPVAVITRRGEADEVVATVMPIRSKA